MRDYSKRNFDYSTRRPKPNVYSTVLNLRITNSLKSKIFEQSKKENLHVSKVIRKALEEYLERNKE